jgi:hypothetical protein
MNEHSGDLHIPEPFRVNLQQNTCANNTLHDKKDQILDNWKNYSLDGYNVSTARDLMRLVKGLKKASNCKDGQQ